MSRAHLLPAYALPEFASILRRASVACLIACWNSASFSWFLRMRRCNSCSRFCRSACCCLNSLSRSLKFLFHPHTLQQLFKAHAPCSSANGRGLSLSVAVCFFLGDLHRIVAARLAHLQLIGGMQSSASSYTMLALMMPG